jgi:hypothetical protein
VRVDYHGVQPARNLTCMNFKKKYFTVVVELSAAGEQFVYESTIVPQEQVIETAEGGVRRANAWIVGNLHEIGSGGFIEEVADGRPDKYTLEVTFERYNLAEAVGLPDSENA